MPQRRGRAAVPVRPHRRRPGARRAVGAAAAGGRRPARTRRCSTPTRRCRAATLRIAPTATWMFDYYPMRLVRELPDGSCEAQMTYASEEWMARLRARLRLGGAGAGTRVAGRRGCGAAARGGAAGLSRSVRHSAVDIEATSGGRPNWVVYNPGTGSSSSRCSCCSSAPRSSRCRALAGQVDADLQVGDQGDAARREVRDADADRVGAGVRVRAAVERTAAQPNRRRTAPSLTSTSPNAARRVVTTAPVITRLPCRSPASLSGSTLVVAAVRVNPDGTMSLVDHITRTAHPAADLGGRRRGDHDLRVRLVQPRRSSAWRASASGCAGRTVRCRRPRAPTSAPDGECRLLATAPFDQFMLRLKVGLTAGHRAGLPGVAVPAVGVHHARAVHATNAGSRWCS